MHALFSILQRQKNSYPMYPKADPTPVTSSAPPVSTLYTPPVVRFPLICNVLSLEFLHKHVFYTKLVSFCRTPLLHQLKM